jgi:hypothetical protein
MFSTIDSTYFLDENNLEKVFLASPTLNDMFAYCEQLWYLDFYTLTKLSVILPDGVCEITGKF